ncbi:MAG: hypothetical protein KDD43_16655, partial [Bdellovibrionales bacterium]|nr:hypothetical protein [Bdellovibrionales bacterium]
MVKAEVPAVLRDPYVLEAFSREAFRHHLQDLIARLGERAPISDFKQIADALPRRSLSEMWSESGKRPEELSESELVQYILKNYRLADVSVLSAVNINNVEKVPSPPRFGRRLSHWVERSVEHIHLMWGKLLFSSNRPDGSTLLQVPKPYVVAGGRFREFYFWDSFWIMK